MRIGELNQLITIQRPEVTRAASGEETISWTDEATVKAAVWPVSAKAHLESDQVQMTATHRVRIRYRSVMRHKWRISYKSRIMEIVSIINPNEANRILDIICKEIRT